MNTQSTPRLVAEDWDLDSTWYNTPGNGWECRPAFAPTRFTEVLQERKARIYRKDGVWYAVHERADYPGVGGDPRAAFESLMRHSPVALRRLFLRVVKI